MREGTTRGVLIAVALIAAACESTPPRQYSITLLGMGTVPADLVTLATEVRSEGGVLFVGTITNVATASSALVPDRPEPGLDVAYPRVLATIAVTDDLGWSLPASVDVLGGDGRPVIVDETGAVQTDWVISGPTPLFWTTHVWMPDEGTHLFFTIPQPEGDLLRWVTSVADAMASGEGTRSGDDVALVDLTTP